MKKTDTVIKITAAEMDVIAAALYTQRSILWRHGDRKELAAVKRVLKKLGK